MTRPRNSPHSDLKPIIIERMRNCPNHEIAFWILIFSCALWLYILKPIPNAAYVKSLAEICCYLFIFYLTYRLLRPEEVFTVHYAIFALIISFYAIYMGFSLLSNNAEVILVYADVFEALEEGKNPYSGNHIYHRVEGGEVIYGNFNYLPLEIIPYYIAYCLTGTWNATILAATNLLLNALACSILWNVFSEIERAKRVLLLVIVMLAYINYTSGLTLIFVSLFLASIKFNEGSEPQFIVGLVMGLGLITKFLFLIISIFYGWNLVIRGHTKKLMIEFGLGFAIAIALILPFGIENVILATFAFQGELERRDEMTTFYPNALSGFIYALNIKFLYPIIAFLIFLGFLMAYRDSTPHCIFLGVVLSMFLFPTPEPQFLSSIFVIMLWTKLIERQRRDPRIIEDQPECQLNSKMDCIA